MAAGDVVNLNVQFQAAGELYSGQKIRSSTVNYPITVFRSTFAGCGGDRIAPTGICGLGGGQDGTPSGCCADPNFTDACEE
jgi:hypothetical protein